MELEQGIEILARAGLSNSQAKVYLCLLSLGKAPIELIAKIAKTDPANTHRTISNLQSLALVNKIVARPNLYVAIPIQDGIEHLLKRRRDDYSEVKLLAERLASRFSGLNNLQGSISEEQIMVIPPRTSYVSRSLKNFEQAKHSIDLITTNRRSTQSKAVYSSARQDALKRGVKIRLITDDLSPPQRGQTNNSSSKSMSNFEARVMDIQPRVVGGIFDRQAADIILNPSANYLESPCLFTTSISLVFLFQNYFDTLWDSL